MSVIEYIIGGILLVLAIALVAIIGMQQGKRGGLGNSIAGQGASESYLAKNNIGNKDKTRQKLTLVIAIAFVVLTLALFIIGSIEETPDSTTSTTSTTSTVSSTSEASKTESSVAESSVAETSAEASAEASAEESK